MNHGRFVILACMALLASGGEALADAPVRILTKDGAWIDGQLQDADPEMWTIESATGGGSRRLSTTEIVAFIAAKPGFDQEAPAPMSAGLLELGTGERLPGNLRTTSSGADSSANYWDHRWIGAVPIALDDMASIRLRGATIPARRPDGDTLLLLNGDILTGFIDSIGESIVFEPAGEIREKRTIALDRTAAIAFAQSERAPTGLSRFWTIDGSVVDGTDLRYDGADGWGFTLANKGLSSVRGKRTDDNAAANPVAAVFATAELVPLASFGRPAVSVPSGQFHFGFDDAARIEPVDRAMLGLANIELDGPIEARFTMPMERGLAPAGGVFSCEVSLREPFPSDARVDVEIALGAGPSKRLRLDASSPREQVRIESGSDSPASITVRIGDGGNGVAGDVVVLRRACIISPRR